MKHTIHITILLIAMFFLTQLVGLFVIHQYSPQTTQVTDDEGNVQNVTFYNLPFGMDPPQDVQQKSVGNIAASFAIIFAIAIVIMLLLMRYKADVLIRLWFFVVVALAIGITLNSFLFDLEYSSLIALIVALPIAFYKVFRRNLIVHNLSELVIYPGIAAIFVALVLSWTASPILAVSVVLILISVYDMYAVWHSGFMQRMAQYQIKNLKLFTGFFVPYMSKQQKQKAMNFKKSKSKNTKEKKIRVSVAILGGGDVVFPIILAGVVLVTLGLLPALIVAICATLALMGLFWLSEKGKFYPAMPFISAGCFVALGLIYLIF